MVAGRELGYWESFCHVLHKDYFLSSMAQTVVLARGPLRDSVLKSALRQLQERHPLLRARIVEPRDRERHFRFHVSPEAGDLPLVVQEPGSASTWRTIAENEFHIDFDARYACHWRVSFLPATEVEGPHALIMMFHHALADGICMVAFVQELLNLCSALARDRCPEVRRLPLLEPFRGVA